MMETLKEAKISTLAPQELLGRPLNDVERKYGPPKLYLASNEKVPLPSPQSAIVGSRRASPERMRTAGEIVEILVRKGVIVVSGLAEGIDAAAHKASIEGGG